MVCSRVIAHASVPGGHTARTFTLWVAKGMKLSHSSDALY